MQCARRGGGASEGEVASQASGGREPNPDSYLRQPQQPIKRSAHTKSVHNALHARLPPIHEAFKPAGRAARTTATLDPIRISVWSASSLLICLTCIMCIACIGVGSISPMLGLSVQPAASPSVGCCRRSVSISYSTGGGGDCVGRLGRVQCEAFSVKRL